MSIKAKQVAGVTTLVVVVVAILSAYHLATLARLSLEETASRGEMLAQAISKRAREVVATAAPGTDPYEAIGQDGGVQSILQSSVGYSSNVNYAAIVDRNDTVVASFPPIERTPMPEQEDLAPIVTAGPMDQLRAVYSDRTFEVRETLLAGNEPFATIRIGVSMLLVRSELQQAANRAATTVLGALIVSSLVAMLLAQWMLRPIHVIQSGLTRLGRGELDVRLDLPEQEFRDLGNSFEAVSAQLSALGRSAPATTQVEDNTVRAGGPSDFESVMDNLEDAVALFSPAGELIFNNAAMTALLHDIDAGIVSGSTLSTLAPTHPLRQLVEQTLAGRKSAGPISFSTPSADSPSPESRPSADRRAPSPDTDERLLMSHAIEDTQGRFLGAMLVARNLAYLTQVHSTLNYSRKLAALGRLMAGVAHEVKNPLNAMTIHLELLKQKLSRQAAASPESRVPSHVEGRVPNPGSRAPSGEPRPGSDIAKHVTVISDEIRRLDQVVVGFLKFVRPEELKLQPVHLASLMSDVRTTVAPDAERRGITIKSECPDNLPEINADPGMLRQALLNLAINACHAMENGGTLRLACRAASRRRVEIDVEDTGIGIPPENLGRIFDLYFTTKEKGSGIGLSMVFRIVQLHDGEVEVQSTPGAGTRFRLIFPQA